MNALPAQSGRMWSEVVGPLPTMVLAIAPGSIAEICITAKALQLGVPLVTAARVTRVLILVTTTFGSEYRRRMARAYPRQPDGKTLFPFRRLFIVAGF